jgi:high affinity Mn2+ porin
MVLLRDAFLPTLCIAAALIFAPDMSLAADDPDGPVTDETVAIHAQSTFVEQGALAFHAPYAGTNSLSPATGRETFDVTLYGGLRPWRGAELWIDPEVDQGFGLNSTLGVAGFPNGEAYKIGARDPYFRLQRLFLRQTIDLGGGSREVDADLNQLAGARTANRLVLWIGKFSVTDVFDTNARAHDPRGDFMNWALIDTGSFDYAADPWGYTYGAAAEWYQGGWTLRGGVFDLSMVPNSQALDPRFDQFQLIAEIERRYSLASHDGRLLVTGFVTRGRMASFADAIRLSEMTGQPANVADVRHYQSRPGVSLDLEQQLKDDLSLFLRAGVADGDVEPFEFTDIDQTVAGGLSLSGKRWGREDDTVGIGMDFNAISKIHQEYLADGGLGILIGDGKLPHPGPEQIVEAYYKIAITPRLALSLDGQWVGNPAYNRDRGPVPILGARLHAQF